MLDQRDEHRLQPVRDSVRRAAWQTWSLRVSVRWVLFLLCALPPILWGVPVAVRNQWQLLGVTLVAASTTAAAAATLASRAHQRSRARRLQGRIAALRTSEREQLLDEMRRDKHTDVRGLAQALAAALPPAGRELLPRTSALVRSGHANPVSCTPAP